MILETVAELRDIEEGMTNKHPRVNQWMFQSCYLSAWSYVVHGLIIHLYTILRFMMAATLDFNSILNLLVRVSPLYLLFLASSLYLLSDWRAISRHEGRSRSF